MTKLDVLTALREKDDYVSGQELCERFQVSRTAVWKRIRQLQAEGYEIEAVPNRGYRISGCPDVIAAEEVGSRLKTKWMGRPVRYFEVIDSTNRYAKKAAEDGAPEGLLVIGDEQTAGRGRSGRHWTTPPGTAIAMTILLRPEIAADRIAMTTLVMGLAVTQAVRELYDIPAGIKWPNDVVINGKKLCGILTEMSAEVMHVNHIVIGVGINANMTSFPEELSRIATSLKLELGRDVSRAELIAQVMAEFERLYEKFEEDGDLRAVSEEYNALCLNAESMVRVLDPNGEYTGTSHGINALGELLVETESGQVRNVYAGEVSVRGVYGYV